MDAETVNVMAETEPALDLVEEGSCGHCDRNMSDGRNGMDTDCTAEPKSGT